MPIDPLPRAHHAAELGRRLRELRVNLDLSQEEVAHRAGISRNQYQLIERGLSNRESATPANPRLSTLVALCDALDTSVTDLVVDIFGPPHGLRVEVSATLHGTVP